MIRTARILLAGLLHVLAAKVDVRDTVMFDMTYDDELTLYYAAMHARAEELDTQARMN